MPKLTKTTEVYVLTVEAPQAPSNLIGVFTSIDDAKAAAPDAGKVWDDKPDADGELWARDPITPFIDYKIAPATVS